MLRSVLAAGSLVAAAGAAQAGPEGQGDAAAPACAPWPGEPAPLPNAEGDDLVAARWAAFRAAELAGLAAEAELRSRALAHALWTHVACLDGRRPEVAGALERTRPVRVRRPPLATVRELPGRRGSAQDAARRLGDPVALVGLRDSLPAVSEGPPATSSLARAETAASEAESALREARFEDALARVERARAELPERRRLVPAKTRLEVVGATAALALGREDEARAGFGRALALDPSLELDRAAHSPKVYRLFRAVRESRADATRATAAPPAPTPPETAPPGPSAGSAGAAGATGSASTADETPPAEAAP